MVRGAAGAARTPAAALVGRAGAGVISSLDAGRVAAVLESPGSVQAAVGGVDDGELLRLIGVGDTRALALFYRRHGPASLWLACHVIGDCKKAEDVTREAFVSIWRRDGGDRTEGESAREWILAIVRHRAIDALNRSGPLAHRRTSKDAKPVAQRSTLQTLEA